MFRAVRCRPPLFAIGVACACLWAGMPGMAAADSVLVRNADDSVTITANEADAPVTISVFTCTSFFFGGGCDPAYTDFTSDDGFTESSAECTDASGGAETTIRCQPLAPAASVTTTNGDDVITSNGNFLSSPALTVDARGGDDRVDGSLFGSDDVSGGAGSDLISLLSGNDRADGGAGDDDISASGGSNDLAGGDGDDRLTTGSGLDVLAGGSGDDDLTSGAGDDSLAGGDGRDVLDAGDGADSLDGGSGRDDLRPGSGTDSVTGGPGTDSVSYAGRAGDVTVALGGAGNGEAGENDTVAGDVEDVVTGTGNDTVTGSGVFNRIETGAGNDVVDPRGDSDFVDAGPGDDTVHARDGAIDRIECGSGNDRAVTDEFDVTSGCEVNESSRELMADVDNDGVALPVDCDDRDPRRRPGLPDQPGNGFDEDCDGADAKFQRILSAVTHRFRIKGSRTRFPRLAVIDVPDKSTVVLRCLGGKKRGCRKKVLRTLQRPAGAEKLKLNRQVRKLRLRRRAKLEVRITRPETIGKLVRFKVRGRKSPKAIVRCIQPGETRPRRC